MKRFDVACLGNIIADFTQLPESSPVYPAYKQNPGGDAANIAFAIARLGGRAVLIAKLGDDCIGRVLGDCLGSEGVDLSGMVMDKTRNSGLAFIHIADDGERSFSFYGHDAADLALTPAELNRAAIAESKILSFGARSISEPSIRETTSCAVSIAKENNTRIAFDPNVRLQLWSGDEMARKTILDWIPRCDYLKLSENELLFLTGIPNPEKAAEQFIGCGPELIVITKGSQGAVVYAGGLTAVSDAFAVKAVDTTGAGDSFWGGTLFLLSNRNDGAFTSPELQSIVRFGCACGAIATLHPGGGPAMPYYHQIKPLMEARAPL